MYAHATLRRGLACSWQAVLGASGYILGPLDLFTIVHFFYLLSLGVIVGGSLALGAATAPALFASMDRASAGTVFGNVLARWDAVAILAALALLASSAARFFGFETPETRLFVRYAAIGVAAVATLYSSAWANPIARALRRQTPHFDELPADAPERRDFAGYHRNSRRAMTLAVLAGLVAIFFS